ncbi:hypothetical protein DUD99_16110 [Salmonella enterica subsp. enterica]|nr:hypothetical protein [Salmonella enterica]EAC2143746.1 hypothetical protein [Salmonella enterica subsp. enterica]EDR2627273.1 hypothetical protein [Salmonella enterica subsp. enterica serovar Thompson]EDW0652912.1 hypothetical protein [Salmonella enterica subsp. enterica serovar Weslaco]EAQ6073395.1 hypothetical protein [Salmonella enterica]
MAEGQADTITKANGSGTEVKGKGEPAIYFHHDSEVVLFMDAADSLELEQEHERLNDLVVKNIDARLELERVTGQCMQDTSSTERSNEQTLLPLYQKVEAASEALRNNISQLSPLEEDKTPLLSVNAKRSTIGITELIQIKNGYKGYKYTYVTSDKIKNHIRRYSLNQDEKKSGSKSFITTVTETDANGQTRTRESIDYDKLWSQILKLKPLLKLWEWKLLEDNSGVWGQWAKDFNESLKTSPYKGEHFAFDSQSQLMRWSYGATARADLAPLDINVKDKSVKGLGDVSGKASFYASFALAESRTKGTLYLPDIHGWRVDFPHKNGGTGTLGTFLFELTLTLSGSVGASIGIEVGANMKGDSIKGIPGKAGGNGEGAPGRRKIDISKALDDSDVKAELSVFVGAESGTNLDGALKWKNPEEQKEFKQLAKVGAGIAMQAGAGFSALLAFSYKGGKIRCHAKAGLCWGKGAKGSVLFEVDVKAIYEEFVPCLSYMLRNMDYARLHEIMIEEDYYAFCALTLLALGTGGPAAAAALIAANTAKNLVNNLVKDWNDKERRVEMMEDINSSNGDKLKYALPEARGAAIAAMMETNFWDRISPASNEKQPCEGPGGTMSARKLAILNVLRWVQSQRDFENTMQHLNKKPQASTDNWEANRDTVLEFLAKGEGTTIYPYIGAVESSHYAQKLGDIYQALPVTADVEHDKELKPVNALYISGCKKLVDQQHGGPATR